MSEKVIFTAGQRPHTVRVIERTVRGTTALTLRWTDRTGARRRRVATDHGSRRETLLHAKADAKRLAAELLLPAAPSVPVAPLVTVADVYEAHVQVRGSAWRANTRRLYADAYRLWSAFVGPTTDVRTLNGTHLARFVAELVRTGTQKANAVRIAQRVRTSYRTAIEAQLLETHGIATLRLQYGRDFQAEPIPEFQPAQAAALVDQLDPRRRDQWRPWAFMMLAGILGPRQNALRLQAWANIDMHRRAIRWPAETDKVHRERWQRLPRAAVLVLRVIRVWQAREGYAGPLLFPSPQRERQQQGAAWTYAAAWRGLQLAAARAGVPLQPMQAMHAWRRFVFNEVRTRTGGDLAAAMAWIGDTDLRAAQKYLRERPDEGARTAALIGAPNDPTTTPQRARPSIPSRATSTED